MTSAVLPEEWPLMTLRQLHAGGILSVDPREFPEESFEYFSIPAYKDGGSAAIVAGRDIGSQKLLIPDRCLLFGKLNPRVEKVWNVASTSTMRRLASTEWLPIVPSQQLDPDFGYLLLWSDWVLPIAKTLVSGSTPSRERVEPKSFYDIEVPVPPLPEQRKIAAVLLTLEQAVRKQAELITALYEVKRSAMGRLFSHGLGGEQQKETDLGLVPESWEVVPFANIRKRLQYGTSVRCGDSGRFAVLRIPNVEAGRLNTRGLKYCDMPKVQADRYVLERGDLLFIRTNGVLERLGSCAVYEGDPETALFASYLIRAQLIQSVEPRFIALYLGSEQGTAMVASRATPAADGKYNINTGTIDSFPVPVPPSLEEQRQIVTIIDGIDGKIEICRRKAAALEEFFKTLLHDLLSGAIRVEDLDLSALREPAKAEVAE